MIPTVTTHTNRVFITAYTFTGAVHMSLTPAQADELANSLTHAAAMAELATIAQNRA